MVMKCVSLVAAIAAGSVSLSVASASFGQERSGFSLLPSQGSVAGGTSAGTFTYGVDAGGALEYSIFSPLRATDDGLLLYDLGLGVTFDDDFDAQGISARAGLVYRFRQNETSIWGVNGYLDAVKADTTGEIFGLFSVGLEYERRESGSPSSIQAGGNYYIPFNDYTDRSRYGVLAAAPRDGVDGYISYSRDYDGYSLRGSLEAFNYFDTSNAKSLSGYGIGLDYEFWKTLPEGMTATVSLGVRDDTRANIDPSLRFGLGVDYLIGRDGGQTVPTRDCAIIRDADGPQRVDCSESVIASAGGDVRNKVGGVVKGDARTQIVRLSPPRRNIGFGSIMTPIEYKSQGASVQLVKLAGGGDDTFSFTSDVASLPTSLTTTNGEASSAIIDITTGSYTITETNLPAGWALDSASCVGASTSAQITGGVSFTAEDGDAIVCTFSNNFTPVATTATGTATGFQVTSGTSPITVQIVKTVLGAAPAASYTFDANLNAVDVVLNGTGGAETISGPVVSVPANTQLVINEVSLPANTVLTASDCSISGTAVVCTATNLYTPPGRTLTLVKEIVGDPDQPTQTFELNVRIGNVSQTVPITVPSGERSASRVIEMPPGNGFLFFSEVRLPSTSGFFLVDLSCTGGGPPSNNGTGSFGPIPGAPSINELGGQRIVPFTAGDQVVCTAQNYHVDQSQRPTVVVTKRVDLPADTTNPETFLAALDAELDDQTISFADQTAGAIAGLNSFLSDVVSGPADYSFSVYSSFFRSLLGQQSVTLQGSADTGSATFTLLAGDTSFNLVENFSGSEAFRYRSVVNGSIQENSAVFEATDTSCRDQNGPLAMFNSAVSLRPDSLSVSCTVTNGLRISRVFTGGGGGGAISDIRIKTAIKTLEQSVDGHRIYSFEYKPEVGIAGTYVGVMAQDLVGRDDHALVWDAEGKHWRVRYDLLGMRMATQAEYEKSGISALLAEYK